MRIRRRDDRPCPAGFNGKSMVRRERNGLTISPRHKGDKRREDFEIRSADEPSSGAPRSSIHHRCGVWRRRHRQRCDECRHPTSGHDVDCDRAVRCRHHGRDARHRSTCDIGRGNTRDRHERRWKGRVRHRRRRSRRRRRVLPSRSWTPRRSFRARTASRIRSSSTRSRLLTPRR